MARSQRAALDPDLGAWLLAALRPALRERCLDVADAVLRAIELYDAGEGHETEAAYSIVSDAATHARRQPVQILRGH